MPIIKRSSPLIEEGIYCVQARGVSTSWTKPKNPDGSQKPSHQVFHIPLFFPDGRSVKTNAHVTDKTGFVFENLAKSGEMRLPDDEFTLTTDDLERRRFFINLRHEEFNNQKVAKVSFVTQAWAEQQNPSIAGITFANEAPRPIDLKPASSPTSPGQPPPEASGSATPKPTPPTQPPVVNSMEGMETISEEELQEALEYAKKLRQQKQGGK